MKKILTMVMMMTIAIFAAAMPYTAARNEALFLSDKMAYELGLTATQYEAVYEINLDYLLNVDTRADVFGFWWDVRNRDLRYVLSTWQYDRFMASTYFYRPLVWNAGGWTFSIYSRYASDWMFYHRPAVFVTFKGGHSHRGGSFYAGHHFDRPNPPKGHGHNPPMGHGNHNNNGNWNHGGNHNGNHNGNGNHNNNGNWYHGGNHNNGNHNGNGNGNHNNNGNWNHHCHGGGSAAGIGSGFYNSSCGDITINGGNITTTGGFNGAGIGSGYSENSCSNITINGGNITATGGEEGAGIGTGYDGSCNDITIGDNITRIISTMGDDAPTAIGTGIFGTCGTVTIAPTLIDMTAGKTRTLWPGLADLVLYDNADNTTTISTYADSNKHDIQLRGRTLYRDGTWNTLCLPFDLDDFNGTLLEGFTAMELDTETARNGYVTGLDPMTITYHLNFKSATGIKAGKPYIVSVNPDLVINSTAEWNNFAADVENGKTYENQIVHLDADITISTMVGTSDHQFKGSFDGKGHQLTLDNLPATGQYCAPFRYVDGATIKNLHTTGTLVASEKYRSGLFGESNGKVTISNCWSSVTVNSSFNGDGTHGGFIGEVKSGGNVVIDNCLFDGSFTGENTNCWGGFVGWSQGVTTIKNSAFLPEGIYSLDNSGCMTFRRNKVMTENCYYSVTLGDA